jgi:hypothetical protein
LTEIENELNSVFLAFPTRTSLSLPRILKRVSINWDSSSDTGSFSSDFAGASQGKSYSLSGDESGSADGSVSVSPSFEVDIEEIYANNIPTTSYFFFLKYPVTLSDILARVGGGVSAWPVFKPQSHVLSAVGQSATVSVRGTASASSSGSSENYSTSRTRGSGFGKKKASQTTTITIPPTIHGQIPITNSGSRSSQTSASINIGWTSGFNFPNVTVDRTESIGVNGSGPTTIPTVSGPTDVPRSGLYLIDSRVEIYQYGFARVYAEVLNAGVFA